jgi:hypothetical protein
MTAPPPVIAQQYSSAIFVSLRFQRRKEKCIVRLNKAVIEILLGAFTKL